MWQRFLDQPTFSMANVRTEGPSQPGSSQDHLGGVDPTVGFRPDLSKNQEFTRQDSRLLVVYDPRFHGARIYGRIGGSERQVEPFVDLSRPKIGHAMFYCPKCNTRCGGVNWCASIAMPYSCLKVVEAYNLPS